MPIGDLCEITTASKPTVFFLDDLGQAPASVQAAAMQLILARRINGHKVSDSVTFIAATNRREDKAGVQGILEPVKSRFVSILHMEVDLDDWCRWALENDMPAELVAFIRFRPNLLHDFQPSRDMVNSPSPRTVANVGRIMRAGFPRETEYELYTGAAGEGFASELMGFLKIFRKLPNPDAILLDPHAADVPADPATLYALCAALAARASKQNFSRVVNYAERLPAEFSVMMIKDCITRNKSLENSKPFIEWSVQHAQVLT